MRGYSHFLVSPQIKDILVTESDDGKTITYNIIFNTMNGVFLGITEFSNVSQMAIIRALVLIDTNDLRRVLRGCKNQDTQSDRCAVC